MDAPESIGEKLASVVGEARVVTDPAACAAFQAGGVTPRVVAYPPSAEQVAAVLKLAAERGWAVIPCRNATKLATGNPPARYDIALSLKELNQVWYYEPDDLVASVEPGMKFGDLQHFLDRNRLWLPLDPPGGGRASLGGILATNACGGLRLRYGAPRDMVLGMKIATPAGKIIGAGGRVVKNVAGYDVAKLLVGSYGTLGVIVEATLKLYPRPAGRATFAFNCPRLDVARALRRKIQASHLLPLRMALMDFQALASVASPEAASAADERAISIERGSGFVPTFQLWIEAGGSDRVIERYGSDLCEFGRELGVAVEQLRGDSTSHSWSGMADFANIFIHDHPPGAVLKAVLPIAATEDFLSRAVGWEASGLVSVLADPGSGTVHLGLGGVGLASAVERMRAGAVALGGVLIVERCPPELHGQIDVWGPPGDGVEVMRRLKAVWDPAGILSPGRFVGGI